MPDYGSCEWCVYRDGRNHDICKNCSDNPASNRPKFEMGKVDIFKLARLLKEKRESESHILEDTKEQQSLSAFLTDSLRHSSPRDYPPEPPDDITKDISNLSDLMLLGVKMFLAEIAHIINRRYEDGHVCADFAKEVCDAAYEQGVRCGYVVISFAETDIAHAIVAFDTDHGLKFFEPQNGNEEEIKIGRRYAAQLAGVPSGNIVTRVEIRWNDGMKKIITE